MSKYFPGTSNNMPTDVRGKKAERIHTVREHIPALKVVAADTDGVHASVNGAAHELITEITNPATPRNITATAGGTAGSIKAVQVVIEGTNYNDDVITETLPAFTVDTPGTVEGNKAFKTVAKITIPAHDAASAATEIGWGDKLGLPYRLDRNTVLAAYLNKTREATAPTVVVSATAIESNTVDLNSALDGHDVDIDLVV